MPDRAKPTLLPEHVELKSADELQTASSMPVGELHGLLYGVDPLTPANVRRWPLRWPNNPPVAVDISNMLFALSRLTDPNGAHYCQYNFTCVVSAKGYSSTNRDGMRSTFKLYINGATGIIDSWFIDMPVDCGTSNQIFRAEKSNIPANFFTDMYDLAGSYDHLMHRC